jgi:hypothetical protein
MNLAAEIRYRPVAATPHVSVKLMLLPLGKLGKIKPPPVRILGQLAASGHVAAGVPPLGTHAVTVQLLRPALGVSRTTAPSAELGPALETVTV